MVDAWRSSENPQLQTLAVRLYELLASRGDATDQWLPGAVSACRTCLALEDDWHAPYQALQTMQVLLQNVPRSVAMLSPVFDEVVGLLTYSHAWCRIAACRVVGAFFAGGFGASPAQLVRTAKQLVEQLRSPLLDDALTLQIVRNLVFIGKTFASEGGTEDVDDEEADDEAADDEEGVDEEGEDEDSEDDAPDSAALENPLAWLFTKLSYAARIDQHASAGEQPPYKRAAAVFKWFAAMATQLQGIDKFLTHILIPLYRVTDDTTRSAEHGELQALAREVLELLQTVVGTSAFAATYNSVQQRASAQRRSRRTERLLRTVKDPEQAAKRRAARNTAKHASRKRKNAANRERRQGAKRHRS